MDVDGEGGLEEAIAYIAISLRILACTPSIGDHA